MYLKIGDVLNLAHDLNLAHGLNRGLYEMGKHFLNGF
jgi:hypothetical protein